MWSKRWLHGSNWLGCRYQGSDIQIGICEPLLKHIWSDIDESCDESTKGHFLLVMYENAEGLGFRMYSV
jgi:hypothetical protein